MIRRDEEHDETKKETKNKERMIASIEDIGAWENDWVNELKIR